MRTALKHALVVLVASSLLVTGLAGTTAGRGQSMADSHRLSQTQSQQPSASQLESMSCGELRATYEQGVERIRNSDLPEQRKQRLVQRSTALYNLYKFRKGC